MSKLNRSIQLSLTLLLSVLVLNSKAHAECWNLPKDLNDQNTKISFELDSTWHMVHGKIQGVTGKAYLENAKDCNSVKAKIEIPVAQFDTDNGSRDKKMRSVMQAEKFPSVTLMLKGFKEFCDTAGKTQAADCSSELYADLLIRDVAKEFTIPAQIKRLGAEYEVSGNFTLKWADFGIEDPSILIARIDKEVKINFSCRL